MKFLEIRKNIRTDKVESHRMVTRDEMAIIHPFSADLASWAKGARLNSRFSLTTPTEKYMYIRLDEFNEEDIEKLAH